MSYGRHLNVTITKLCSVQCQLFPGHPDVHKIGKAFPMIQHLDGHLGETPFCR